MKDTVIVIGSGPVSSGLHGAYIDEHPVVRVWNHEWQPVDRYGSRYDFGLITSLDNAREAVRQPKVAWLFYNVPHEEIVSSINGTQIVVLNHARWYVKAAALGARPAGKKALKFTRGFAAVAGVIEYLLPKCVVVFGMDNLCNGFTGVRYFEPVALPYYVKLYPHMKKIPGWAEDKLPAGLRRDGPHDFFTEAKLIRMIAAKAKTELVWDNLNASCT